MDENKLIEEIALAIIDGDGPIAANNVQAALESGMDPLRILNEGLMTSAAEVGKRFDQGEYFLPELMLTGRALKAAMDVLKPSLTRIYSNDASQARGKIVIATIQTDIHDLGKSLVASMLMAGGFDVTDLGVDVPIKSIIDKAEEAQANVIALSCLLTTSMPYMKDLIEMLKARGLRKKYIVIVGGASVTQAWASSIGADGTAGNAVDAVKLIHALLNAA
jgi:5-methyltetrahydrofolate--homocysteine methyltransferase/trimethylamine corrinoid protein